MASTVFPVLQTQTLKGWAPQLATHTVTKIFPALRLLLAIAWRPCAPRTSPSLSPGSSIWGNGGRVDWHSPRPCCITGLPSLWELKLQTLKFHVWPCPVWLDLPVGELPWALGAASGQNRIGETVCCCFAGPGQSPGLSARLDGSLQEHSSLMSSPCVFGRHPWLASVPMPGWGPV